MLTTIPQLLLACNFECFASYCFRIMMIDVGEGFLLCGLYLFLLSMGIVADPMGAIGFDLVVLALVLSFCM